MMAARISSIPIPLLPLASKISSGLQPISSMIWSVYFLDHCTFHVNFIDDRNDLKVIINGQVKVADGLCLYALRWHLPAAKRLRRQQVHGSLHS